MDSPLYTPEPEPKPEQPAEWKRGDWIVAFVLIAIIVVIVVVASYAGAMAGADIERGGSL
jgi:energy-coupling factor transporter transmembrane protein EcfT